MSFGGIIMGKIKSTLFFLISVSLFQATFTMEQQRALTCHSTPEQETFSVLDAWKGLGDIYTHAWNNNKARITRALAGAACVTPFLAQLCCGCDSSDQRTLCQGTDYTLPMFATGLALIISAPQKTKQKIATALSLLTLGASSNIRMEHVAETWFIQEKMRQPDLADEIIKKQNESEDIFSEFQRS
jgi:uncharacterized membrane protein YcfT